MDLAWYVFVEDVNRQGIVPFNVFHHPGFLDGCVKAACKARDIETFGKLVRRELHYYYWAKCEWEIVLTCWPPYDKFPSAKVDVSKQIEMNWLRFIDYLWASRQKLLDLQ